MKLTKTFLQVCALCAVFCAQFGMAADKKLLLINLTSYMTQESRKAIDYAKAELEQGRSVVIFLNERGVLAASKANARTYKEQQRNLTDLMKKGATVLVCPDCMTFYSIEPSSLIAGVKIADHHHS
jgi:sulfur relay (sulfurtransferase) complex TusBCD TusD component (DsrE family)